MGATVRVDLHRAARIRLLLLAALLSSAWWSSSWAFAAGLWSAELSLPVAVQETQTIPAPWSSADIGAVGLAGSATHSNGVFTIKGAGADIWSTKDSFHFVHQSAPGDAQIVARVTGTQNKHPSAKAGVMLRGSLAANAPHVILALKPDGQIEFMTRSTAGGTTTYLRLRQ